MKFIKKIVSFVLVLATMASISSAALAADYTDIPVGIWYESAVNHVTEHGIFSGYTDGRFGPDDAITREMFATALGRLAGVEKDTMDTSQFNDVDPASWSASYIAWAYENGVVGGTTATTFSPKANITREQVAVVLDNYLALVGVEAENKAENASTYVDADEVSPWAVKGVQSMRDHGLMGGNNAGEFKPLDSISRAEAAVVLTRLHELMQGTSLPKEDDSTDSELQTPSGTPSFSVSVAGYLNPQALVFRTTTAGVMELYVKTGAGDTVAASGEDISIFPADLSGDMSWKAAPNGSIYPMFLPQHYTFRCTDSSVISVDANGSMTAIGSGSASIVVTCLDDSTSASILVHVNSDSSAAQEIDSAYLSAVQSEIVRLMNAERISAGLPALEYISAAQPAADIRAAEFAINASHTRPDGTMFSSVIKDIGLDGGFHAENGTTYTFGTEESAQEVAKGIMDGWMNSSGHRGNILDDFHQSAVVGIHIEDGPAGSYRIYAIQLFSGYAAEKFK